MSRHLEAALSAIDQVLDDTGQTSSEAGYSGSLGADECWRCRRPNVGGESCEPCRAWMTGESDTDPLEQPALPSRPSPYVPGGRVTWSEWLHRMRRANDALTSSPRFEDLLLDAWHDRKLRLADRLDRAPTQLELLNEAAALWLSRHPAPPGYIMLGGPKHGERFAVRPGHYMVTVAMLPATPVLTADTLDCLEAMVETTTYQMVRWADNGVVYDLLIHEPLLLDFGADLERVMVSLLPEPIRLEAMG